MNEPIKAYNIFNEELDYPKLPAVETVEAAVKWLYTVLPEKHWPIILRRGAACQAIAFEGVAYYPTAEKESR